MMKAQLRYFKIFSLVFTIFLCFLLSKNATILVCAKNSTNTSSEKSIINDDEKMTISVDYGYAQYAKYGRYMAIKANILNKETDFHGWLEVIVPSEKDSVAYRKEFSVTANQSTEVSVTVPVIDDTGLLNVKIIDKKHNTIVEKEYKLKIGNYEKQLYIGLLSDNPEELEYMNTLGSRVFNLDESNLSDDYLGLELLDIIVINHFDTNRLSETQLNAIEKWVMEGGTLVIGTGEYVTDTLASLSNTYGISFSNEFNTQNLTLGMNEDKLKEIKQLIKSYEDERKYLIENIKSRNEMLLSYGRLKIEAENTLPENWAKNSINNLRIIPINKNIANVQLENSVSLITEQNYKLLQLLNYGQGKIQLFSIDLGVSDNYRSMGTILLTKIAQNISQVNLTKIQEEYYGISRGYSINNSISNSNDNNIPETGKYIVLLIIYVLLIGPITFFILKKLDKRSLTWVVVPAVAVVFTILIYCIGTETRISKPFIGYIEILQFKDDSMVEDEVYFSITAPYNHDYKVDLVKDSNVKELKNSSYNYYFNNLDSKNIVSLDHYSSAINYGIDDTSIEIKDNPAFTPLYYQSKDTITMDNQLITNVSYIGEKISGSVSNEFDFDLMNAMLMSDGYLVNIGSIKSGEKISLNDKEGLYLSTKDEIYNTDIINRIAGGTSDIADNTREINQKSNVLNYFVENKLMFNSFDSFVVGFVNDDSWKNIDSSKKQDGFIHELSKDMKTFGLKVVIIPIDVNYNKDNRTFVSSIDPYAISEGMQNRYYGTRYLSGETTTIEYRLPETDDVISMEYLANRNQDGVNEYLIKFEGIIFFFNQKSGNFDEVFKVGTGSSVSNVSDYISDENTITIRYSSDLTLNGYQMVLPHISYWKEAESNVKN
jgi:hypothetical protein